MRTSSKIVGMAVVLGCIALATEARADDVGTSRELCLAAGGRVDTGWAYNDQGVQWGETFDCRLPVRHVILQVQCSAAGGRFETDWVYNDGAMRWGQIAACTTSRSRVVCRDSVCRQEGDGPNEILAAILPVPEIQ